MQPTTATGIKMFFLKYVSPKSPFGDKSLPNRIFFLKVWKCSIRLCFVAGWSSSSPISTSTVPSCPALDTWDGSQRGPFRRAARSTSPSTRTTPSCVPWCSGHGATPAIRSTSPIPRMSSFWMTTTNPENGASTEPESNVGSSSTNAVRTYASLRWRPSSTSSGTRVRFFFFFFGGGGEKLTNPASKD